ncbi:MULTISPECIES: SDR family NAD(P)-dependent oxidoreductase [unclassified Bradyrhizobium]|uniref:SDR family NAD(P)-dependent oxidoreductase n=1 Tax=unclassified Bradyrhizobium TaxID=2631580 RepID=UPI00247939F4|nr:MULTISPECIES: SDR family NAD(P)-dependent oxidoreductase [unclassified Bradyrhizobium]WGS18652.1 SDR family oxidoreductase [Bradyrhizobium sp. ISRA463]WGS25475.1 SDR family oxidoreductase [Bradyrhizobium sp. ISRA464]
MTDGRAIALLLAQRSAVNYAGHADAAEQVASEIKAGEGRAITARADVSDFRAVQAMIQQTAAQLGAVTILVNNAGVSHQATLDTFDDQQFERMRRVNADGVIHATRAVMTGMRAAHYGRIINITSIAAISTALPGNAFYAATKAEAAILTRRFAMELGPDGITVNAVAPGFVRTDMTQGRRSTAEWEAIEKRLAERTMMGRIGQPADIANAVAFLADPESDWVTAQMLVVDGGRTNYIAHG